VLDFCKETLQWSAPDLSGKQSVFDSVVGTPAQESSKRLTLILLDFQQTPGAATWLTLSMNSQISLAPPVPL